MAFINLSKPPEFKMLTPQSVTEYFVQNGVYKLFEYRADISEADSQKLIQIIKNANAESATISGFASPGYVEFNVAKLKNILTYQISEVNVPASALSKLDISKANESPWPVAVQTATPESFTIKFKCDQFLTEWAMMHRWKNYTANRYGPRFLEEYALTLSIYALKPPGKPESGADIPQAISVSRIDVFDAFPLSIDNPTFNQNAEDGEDGWFETTVEFGCSHIRINGLT
jgi:hypothetical protein